VWRLVDLPGWRWVAALVAVGLVVLVWARAAAPTASVSGAVRWSVRIAVFATAAVLLGLTVGVWLAVGFVTASVAAWWLATALPTPPELAAPPLGGAHVSSDRPG